MWIIAEIAILETTDLVVFFDWVPSPLNRNIQTTPIRDRLGSTLLHGGIGFVLFARCTPGFPPYASLIASTARRCFCAISTHGSPRRSAQGAEKQGECQGGGG